MRRSIPAMLLKRSPGAVASIWSTSSATVAGQSGRTRRISGMPRLRHLAGEQRERDRPELPLVRRRRREPSPLPLGRLRCPAQVGHHAGRDLVARDRPLPAEHPGAARRREVGVVRRDRAVHTAGVVQIRERRSDRPDDAQRERHRLRAAALEALAHRLAGDPAPQIAGPTTAPGVHLPEVVGRRDHRVAAVRERPRLAEEPGMMRRVGRGHERERTPERVPDLLRMTIGRVHAAAPPPPIRREQPAFQMGGDPAGVAVRPGQLMIVHAGRKLLSATGAEPAGRGPPSLVRRRSRR
jgi:hypothetical protein